MDEEKKAKRMTEYRLAALGYKGRMMSKGIWET
jgi:hypothetical protein